MTVRDTARRGRPLKFGRPSTSVTMTLPIETVDALREAHADIARAIVRMVALNRPSRRRPSVGLAHFGSRSVIVVRPVAALRRLPGIELVPLPDSDAALIAFTEALTIAKFELRVQDALETWVLSSEERSTLNDLGELLKNARRSGEGAVKEYRIMVLEKARRPRKSAM